MADKKNVDITVTALVEELKSNGSARFSKSDFQTLVYGILSDPDFKAKKYLLRSSQLVEEEYSYGQAMRKFMDKLLKHAGIANAAERTQVLDTFEYSAKDIEWVTDAVDEAMHIYTECGKNMRVFRDKMLQLTVKKVERSGKYAEKNKFTYKKSVMNRLAMMDKKS